MKIFSKLLNAEVELDGWKNNELNIVVTHKALEDFWLNSNDNLQVDYDIKAAGMDHAVVVCCLVSERFEKRITEIGEVTEHLLSKVEDSFRDYPVLTAKEIAFDRAMIRYLMLPSNTYSVLEFLRNARKDFEETGCFPTAPDPQEELALYGENQPVGPVPEREENRDATASDPGCGGNKKAMETGKTSRNQEKPDLPDWKLTYGIFYGKEMTVKKAFEAAQNDISIKKNINMYLTKDTATVKDSNQRNDLVALQIYARRIGYVAE